MESVRKEEILGTRTRETKRSRAKSRALRALSPITRTSLEPIPAPEGQLSEFISQTQQAYVNKTVALQDTKNNYFFEHSIFESIGDKHLLVTAISTHYTLEDLDGENSAQASSRLLGHVRPVKLESHRNLSADLLRRGLRNISKNRDMPVEYLNLKTDRRLHPKIRGLLPSGMNYSVGIPLFVHGQPIGVLWGIRRHPIARPELKEIRNQLNSLAEGIGNIIFQESRDIKNARAARIFIEKIDTKSKLVRTMYSALDGQTQPLKTVEKYSFPYKTRYTTESSFIIPSSDGFNISIQSYEPQKENRNNAVLLMLPGFFCNRNVMDPLAHTMCLKHGYKVYTLDKRGRSELTLPESRSSANWTIDDYIWYDFPVALDWIAHRHPNAKIIVYGHSMGGMIPRFYTASYEKIKQHSNQPDLIDPRKVISGIVSVTSPTYVNVKADLTGFETVKWSAKFISRNIFGMLFTKLIGGIVNQAMPTLNLQKFFQFWHNLSDNMRKVSFSIGTGTATINDFIGYPGISPPELNFLMDDGFCEESIKVLFQFLRSQFSDKEFLSYDEQINYSKDVQNMPVPLFSVIGTIDKLVPPETIKSSWKKVQAPKKDKLEIPQGHLGIILQPEAVKTICAETHMWIGSLDS